MIKSKKGGEVMTVGVKYKDRQYTVDYRVFAGEYLIDQIIDDEHPSAITRFGFLDYDNFYQQFLFAVYESERRKKIDL
jgi:hypothetical protein